MQDRRMALPEVPAYVQFWRDIPGQADSRREKLALGLCRTGTIAERKAAEKLEQLGVNSAQHFIEATSSVTFKEQGEIWLRSLSTRKRNPLEQTTIDTRQYAMDKWIYPLFDGRLLADINNRAMKELVGTMAPKLSAAAIRDYIPMIDSQRQPSTTADSLTAIIDSAKGHYRMLFALLAGCGPLRAGEALGLEIGKHISPDFRTLYITQKAKRGLIQPYLKTKNGTRKVDLCVDLAAMLKEFVGERTAGLLFHTSSGAQLLQTNILRDSLHPILTRLENVQGGFNIFRRYRITYLGKSDCPDALKHLWSGHAATHISERYAKLLGEREYRLEWAERIGLGFKIPTSVGLPGLLRVVPNAA